LVLVALAGMMPAVSEPCMREFGLAGPYDTSDLDRRDAAIVVFCRAASADARRWGWSLGQDGTSDAGVAGRSAMLRRTLSTVVRSAGGDADVLVFQHGGEGDQSGDYLCPGVRSWQQQRGTGFAERLQDTVNRVFARGYRRVVVVGSDVPQLQDSHIRAALGLLTGQRVVIGGDSTGGCYLIGLQSGCAGVLSGVTWGVGRDFAALLESADRFGGAGVLADRLHDVDRASDVSQLWSESTRRAGGWLRSLVAAAEQLLGSALPNVAARPSWPGPTEPLARAVRAITCGHHPTGPPVR
jgi:glycosyltransferase A (GT-A) superfamily protein (DUF2064 family)